MGRQVNGETVLSIIRGMPNSLPILATSSIGKTFNLGFGIVSPKKALVFSSTSSLNVSGFSGSAKRTSIPNCLKVFTNKFQVPP